MSDVGSADRWVRAGLLGLPLYGALTLWSSISPQPDPGTAYDAWARFVTTDEYVLGHLIGSGGGLIAGIAGYLKALNPGVVVVGCLPANSPVMAESIRAGRIVDMESLPTLSDGTAGGIEPQAITFELCRQLVDDYILVSEDEIAHLLS